MKITKIDTLENVFFHGRDFGKTILIGGKLAKFPLQAEYLDNGGVKLTMGNQMAIVGAANIKLISGELSATDSKG